MTIPSEKVTTYYQRRTVLGWVAAGAFSVAVVGCERVPGAVEPTDPAARSRDTSQARGEHDVGTPLTAIIAATAAFTLDSSQEPLAAYVASGEPAQLNLVNTRSGQLVASSPLSGGEGQSVSSRALTTGAKDRKIYVGLQDGRAYSLDPDTHELQQLPGAPRMGNDSFWNAAALEDGRLLFTTFPTARLLAYDPQDESWRDFGRLGAKNKYSMGISSVRNIAYVGTGTADPALWQVDTATGRKRRISLPAGKKDAERDFVYDTSVVGVHVFARVDSEECIYVYDAQSRKWVGEIEGAARGLAASAPGDPEALYWVGTGGELHRREVPSGRDFIIGHGKPVSELRGHGWQDIQGDGSDSLVTINVSGELLRWDERSDELTLQKSEGTPAPVQVRALGVDPQGKVLVGGYGTAPYFAELGSESEANVQHSLRGQVESFGASRGTVVVGTYPGAGIHVVRDASAEPRWSLGHGQDRPVAIEDLGADRVAVASVPVYGQSGGALTLLSLDEGIENSMPNIAPNRSPLTLARRDRTLYVGTGASGGLGAARDTGDGTVIMVDSDSGEVQKTMTPVPGDATVSSLMFDADGLLWGWGVDTIFELDPETLRVKRKKRYSKARDTESYVRGRNLVDIRSHLAGCARGKVFCIDKQDLRREDIASGNNLILSASGDLIYSRGSKVYRWSFGSGKRK